MRYDPNDKRLRGRAGAEQRKRRLRDEPLCRICSSQGLVRILGHRELSGQPVAISTVEIVSTVMIPPPDGSFPGRRGNAGGNGPEWG